MRTTTLTLPVSCGILAAFLFAVVVPPQEVEAIDPSHFITNTNSCMMTGREPEKPEPLQFCYWFNQRSCCVPGWDLDILKAFVEVADLGAGCSPSKHQVKADYIQVRDYMCMGCDPNEHLYRFRDIIGDSHLGGSNPPMPSAAPDAFTWRICRSWIYGKDFKSGFWGENGTKFDRCGIQLLNDCSAIKQIAFNSSANGGAGEWIESDVPILDGWDPGMCAGDVIFPRLEFADSEVPAERLLQIIPQFIPEFKFVVTDDFVDGFQWEETPCFRGGTSFGMATTAALAVASVLTVLIAV